MNVSNVSTDDKAYALLKEGMDAASLRSKVHANNIANVNTKGYKSYYVTFEDALNDSTQKLDMYRTDPRHIDNVGSGSDISLKHDTDTSITSDGNNVDIDGEMVNQATNTLMYNALITQLNSKYSLTSYIINDGK